MLRTQNKKISFLLVLPILSGVFVFCFIPFLITVWYSFTFGVGGTEWVGLANYAKVLQSSAFQLAAWNTLRFLLVSIPLLAVLSLLFALCLQKKFFGSHLSQSMLLFPMILPAASIVMVIDVFFSKAGIANELLVKFGFPVIDWLHCSAAFWILIALYLWKNIGFCTLIILVGLNEIPNDLYEAAKMDGAGALAQFRFITLPLLKPTMLFVSILSVINCFKIYREAFLLGGPHPDESIYMLQHFLNNNFQDFNYQRLSVAAIVLFVFILTIMCMMLIFRSKKEDDVAEANKKLPL